MDPRSIAYCGIFSKPVEAFAPSLSLKRDAWPPGPRSCAMQGRAVNHPLHLTKQLLGNLLQDVHALPKRIPRQIEGYVGNPLGLVCVYIIKELGGAALHRGALCGGKGQRAAKVYGNRSRIAARLFR